MDTKKSKSSDNESVYEKNPDAPMGYQIKRPHSKSIEHKSKLLQPNSNFIAICGSTGRGKSTILLQALPMFSNKTTNIILASMKDQDDVHDAVCEYCKYEKIGYSYVHTPDETNETLADILDNKKPNEHMIIIFDDFNINYTSKGEDPYNNIMIKCFAMLRSSLCSGIILTQTYNNIPTKVRENLNMRIVFGLGNVYSVRALLDDIIALFYDGDDDNKVKKDIKNIYKSVYQEPHDFIVVISSAPPQIRRKWLEIIYPPDIEGKIEGGSVPKTKKGRMLSEGEVSRRKVLNNKLKEKQELIKVACELGFPQYMRRTATIEQLKAYISKMSAQAEKQAGNTAPEIEEILTKSYETPKSGMGRLRYNMRKYKTQQNPRNLENISIIANKLIGNGWLTPERFKYMLKTSDLDDIFEMN